MSEIEKRIAELHRHLNNDKRHDMLFLPRPFFIEFNGTPTSGKSMTIKQLYNFLKRSGFKVYIPQEGAEVVPHTLRNSPEYNIRTGMYALDILLRLHHGHEYDFVLFDRCIFDTYPWMMYWHEKGKLSEREVELYREFFLSPLWVNDIDAAYCLICEPEASMERENAIALTQKIGQTTKPENIRRLIAHNKRAYAELNGQFPQMRLIDTTEMSPREMVQMIGEDLLETLGKKIQR